MAFAHKTTQTSSRRSSDEWMAALRTPGPERYWALVDTYLSDLTGRSPQPHLVAHL